MSKMARELYVTEMIDMLSTDNLLTCYQEYELMVQADIEMTPEDDMLFISYGKELKKRGVRV